MTETELRDIERRTRRYFYEDGFVEIAVGILFLILGGYFFAGVWLPETSRVRSWLDSSLILVFLAGVFLVRRLVRFLKARVTYPRTGYVAYKKPEDAPRRRVVAAVSGGVIAAAFSALLAVAPSARAWLPALNGLLFAVTGYLLARRTEVTRFYVLAAASALIGLAVVLGGYQDTQGLSLYYAVLGGAVILSGLVALRLYLRRTRLDGEAGHGR